MAKKVANTPRLPKSFTPNLEGQAQALAQLNRALFTEFTEHAQRLNSSFPTDGSEAMTGDLDMGGNDVLDVGDIALLGIIELGHASDTTVSRASAGRIAVEGQLVPQLNTANTWSANQTMAAATMLLLGAGTTSVAPLRLTAGPLLTTPVAGSHEYDGEVMYFTHQGAERGAVLTSLLSSVQGTPVALSNSATTAQNIFPAANDVLTVNGNTTYRFSGQIGLNTGAVSHVTSFGLGGTATLFSIEYRSISTSSAAGALATPQVQRVLTNAATAMVAASTAVTTNILVQGLIRVNAGGTIIPQITFSAGPTGTCEVRINSFIEFWAMGTGTVASVGPWT